jgi:hypothetical protein
MKLPRGRAGNTLVEMSLALAITGLIAVPLATTIGVQLLNPATISREVLTKQQDLKSTLVVSDDTSVAQTFTPGLEPEYGTFRWNEFDEDRPVPTSSRYFFDKGSLFRVIKRGAEDTPPHLVATQVDRYADVTFQHIAPQWSFDSITKTWSYTEGFIDFSIIRTRKTEQGETITVQAHLVADFRPQLTRPVVRPAP